MASNSRAGRRLLSGRLRGMRFMKQKEESEIREKLAAEQAAREKAAHWTLESGDLDDETMPIVIIEDGLSDNPMLGRAGRQSFGHFNPVLEGGKAKPARGNQVAKEEGEMEDVEAAETKEKRVMPTSFQRVGERRNLYHGAKGGVAKKESKPLNRHRHFKKNRPYKASHLRGPN